MHLLVAVDYAVGEVAVWAARAAMVLTRAASKFDS